MFRTICRNLKRGLLHREVLAEAKREFETSPAVSIIITV